MAKAIEHGIRNPRQEGGSEKQEKMIAYGVRSVSSDFDRRGNETNAPKAATVYRAPGAKFDSKEPSFKKFR